MTPMTKPTLTTYMAKSLEIRLIRLVLFQMVMKRWSMSVPVLT
ncbi:hypothetical protein [Streptococcus sanguinis]|uniref:Uncharacterized protein n=1 Tax=Streptococcus sanguinis SK330 TaxID=888813 RepID=F2C8I9_STRSA|nr:hypothetical protein [Streptococcus sanguinis]EGF14059.1 hypothetical protein HMPREF9386_1438 [Streptococcus sanguinis SK330]